jgi:hypothetical protein
VFPVVYHMFMISTIASETHRIPLGKVYFQQGANVGHYNHGGNWSVESFLYTEENKELQKMIRKMARIGANHYFNHNAWIDDWFKNVSLLRNHETIEGTYKKVV